MAKKVEEIKAKEEQKEDDGRSKLARNLRVGTWILNIFAIIIGIVGAIQTESIFAILVSLGAVSIQTFVYTVLAAILDYLAEITSIARNGYKYTETNR